MIAVIADDFTGAAELGGIGLRYGLAVEINTSVNKRTRADLLIVATDTRSMSRQAAVMEMVRVSREISRLRPSLVYKKVDSVLRGHIVQETIAQQRVLGLPKALLAPANPVLGRTIRAGTYYLHGEPVHLSPFSDDPEFAITGSAVHAMLRTDEGTVQVRKTTDMLENDGIILGEAETADDLATWAGRIDRATLAAGGSGFFTAILDKIGLGKAYNGPAMPRVPGSPCLFVCGSSYLASRQEVKNIKDSGGPVSYLPRELAARTDRHKQLYETWCEEVLTLIGAHGRAIIAIEPDLPSASPASHLLRERMARLVRRVLLRKPVAELVIEGGSTAFSILRESGLKTFFPLEEMAPGVIRMRVEEEPSLHITVKPGSYAWPFPLLQPTTNHQE